MAEQKTENGDLELARLFFGRHFLWIALTLAVCVVIYSSQCGLGLAIGVGLNFAGLLLPAWHLSNKVSVHTGKYKDLDEGTRQGLWVTLAGILITAAGYGIALNSLFDKCLV